MLDWSEINALEIRKKNKMILKIAYDRGVNFELISKRRNRLRLSYGKDSYIVKSGNIRDCNTHPLAISIVKMKDVCSKILRKKGYNALESTVFNKNDLERAWQWARPILPIVLKPVDGNLGRNVFTNINDYEEFSRRFNYIAKNFEDIMVEKYVKGKEYRFTYLNGKIIAVSRRLKANVIGDGQHTVSELVDFKNKKREDNLAHRKINLNNKSRRVLSKTGLTSDSVPAQGQLVYLRETSNISSGGDAIDVTDQINPEIKNHIKNSVNVIKGMFFCGIDVIITEDGQPYIIEINNLPGVLGHEHPWEGKPRKVMEMLVDELFPESIK